MIHRLIVGSLVVCAIVAMSARLAGTHLFGSCYLPGTNSAEIILACSTGLGIACFPGTQLRGAEPFICLQPGHPAFLCRAGGGIGFPCVGVDLGLIAILLAFYPIVTAWRGPVRRWSRRMRGLCPTCGYERTGNVSGICPECGTPIAAGCTSAKPQR